VPDELEDVAAVEAERANNWGDADHADEERDAFLAALDDTLAALEDCGVAHLFIGGIASTVLGRPRVTHDLDLMVRPEDARSLLAALEKRGFEVEERAPHWLFKAYRDDQVVDIIFRSSGDIYLDDEMIDRAVEGTFHGRAVSLMSPEDLVVVKAIAHEEVTPRHWHDALCVLADVPLDWDYLAERAKKGPRRVAALLLYAQSNDLPVPDEAIVAVLGGLVPALAPALVTERREDS
jgi:predicted nucleotidyltransferase